MDLPDDTQALNIPPELLDLFEKSMDGNYSFTAEPECDHDTCTLDPSAVGELCTAIYAFSLVRLRKEWDRLGRCPRQLKIQVTVSAK